MNPDLTRSVLVELAEALPAEGQNVLTGIDMRTGWGTSSSSRFDPTFRPFTVEMTWVTGTSWR